MTDDRRWAGLALAGYGVATLAAMISMGVPGGDYDAARVVNFLSAEHFWVAVAMAYVGALGALALLPATQGLGDLHPGRRDLIRRLGVVAAATGVGGWFLSAGIPIAATEGGAPIRDGLPLPVAHTLGEMGILLALCAPALSIGIAATLLARARRLPRWLRVLSLVAGLCGVLAPLFFTAFVFLLWTLVMGAWLSLSTSRATTSRPEGAPIV